MGEKGGDLVMEDPVKAPLDSGEGGAFVGVVLPARQSVAHEGGEPLKEGEFRKSQG